METLDPIDALMLTGELLSSPMHVAVVMILSPPPGVDPRRYVEQLYADSLTAGDLIDPRLRRQPYRGIDTGGRVGRGATSTISTFATTCSAAHCPGMPAPRDCGTWSPTCTRCR